MSYVAHLRGLGSGAVYPADRLMNLDPVDGRPVEMVLDLDRLRHDHPGLAWYHPERPDLWRFGPLLALDAFDPGDAGWIVPLGEGHTPLRPFAHPLATAHGFTLQLKDEGKAAPGYGANPTQSFKDRGMAMTVAMARRFGLQKLVVPTQGNAGDSLVTYALAGGLDVAVVMPDTTPLPIQGRVAALAHRYPERVTLALVSGTIREAGALMRERFVPEGYFNVATFQEPGWRIEGKKTLGLELAEPLPGETAWRLPDVVVYPTGGGTGVLGMGKAWDELEALGVIGPARPRMVCVQSAVTAPLVEAWASGAADTTPAPGGDTLCVGLNVPGGVGHFKVLEIIRASGGCAIAVEEAATAETLRRVWAETRLWISPEGAACLAALEALVDTRMIQPGERVVAVNTGSLEKYLPDVRHLL